MTLQEIPINVLVLGSLLTLALAMSIGHLGFYIVALFVEDRSRLNRIRKLYLIAYYVLVTLAVIIGLYEH